MSPAWAALLRQALGLGITPRAFWALSLAEWRALSGQDVAPVLGRGGLVALMARFPDAAEDEG